MDTTILSREGIRVSSLGKTCRHRANAHLHANVHVFQTHPPSSGIWDLFRAHICWIRSVRCVHGLMRPTRTSQHNNSRIHFLFSERIDRQTSSCTLEHVSLSFVKMKPNKTCLYLSFLTFFILYSVLYLSLWFSAENR